MNDKLLLRTLENLSTAIDLIADAMPDLLTKKAILGRLKVVSDSIAELKVSEDATEGGDKDAG